MTILTLSARERKQGSVHCYDGEKVDVGIPDFARETREDNRFFTMTVSIDSFGE